MTRTDLTDAKELRRTISPAQHPILDYGVAATFLAFGFSEETLRRGADPRVFPTIS